MLNSGISEFAPSTCVKGINGLSFEEIFTEPYQIELVSGSPLEQLEKQSDETIVA